jgi:hypothetical protein
MAVRTSPIPIARGDHCKGVKIINKARDHVRDEKDEVLTDFNYDGVECGGLWLKCMARAGIAANSR